MKQPPKPTPAELELLRVLWEHGPSTASGVHEQLDGETGPTTTLKLLQRMDDKGLVKRDARQRPQKYRAAVAAEKTQRRLVRDLLHSAFGGLPGQLVIQALSEQPASPEELAQIRALLDDIDDREAGA